MELPILQLVLMAMGLFLGLGTLVSLTDYPHWSVRLWDFPRIHLFILLLLIAALYAWYYAAGYWYDWAFLALTLGAAGWHGWCVYPYMIIAPQGVVDSDVGLDHKTSFSLVTSNVLLENEQFDHWLDVVRGADPDLILALEVDDKWVKALEILHDDYPYRVVRAQDNYYGMALFSRLELTEPELRHIIEQDVPSIRAGVTLNCGAEFCLYGLHPKPPEPIRGQSSAARDAELVKIALEINRENGRPTLVMGDLNDVAWSKTTRLFLRISRLLDPRWGRGTYSSFDARYPYIRFPLDHIFHSKHFTLIELRRLDEVGSDHFPIYVALHYEPESQHEQSGLEGYSDDRQEAKQRLDTQRKAAAAAP